MLREILVQYKLHILIIGALIVIASIGWCIYYFFIQFSIISQYPSRSEISHQQPLAILSTTKKIADTPIEYTSTPTDIINSITPDEKNIVVNFKQNIQPNTTYTITLKNISSTSGNVISEYTMIFKAVDNANLLDAKSKAIILERQNHKPDFMNDTAYKTLPLHQDDYYIESIIDSSPDGKGIVRIRVTLFLTPEMIQELGRDQAISKLQKEATSYLDKNGVPSKEYEIEFVNQGP